jgi:hypothetical protein
MYDEHSRSRDSSASTVIRLRAGRPAFDSRDVQKIFSLQPRPDRPNQPPIQWLLGAPSPSVKRPEDEADHVSSSDEVKNAWSCLHTTRLYDGA